MLCCFFYKDTAVFVFFKRCSSNSVIGNLPQNSPMEPVPQDGKKNMHVDSEE